MSLFPSRLVPVRRYVWSSHGQSMVGADDRQLLLDAGIEAYLKLDRSGPALVVPESQAAAARQALASSPDLFAHHFAPPCPRCRTFHPGVRPPYEIVLVGGGFIAAVASVFFFGAMGAALTILTVSVVVGGLVSSRLPHWRCHACGHAFDTIKRNE